MSCLGNLIWVIFGGLLLSVGYMIGGILLCFTIIGIPFGYQLFKIGTLALLPFGKTTIVSDNSGSILSTVMNILWIVLGGLPIALAHLALGVLFCITIIGIPFGIQHFKLMVVALLPFGRTIIDI
ncbi:YccF domain-containing protein [Porphyromonadaceae bacterium]